MQNYMFLVNEKFLVSREAPDRNSAVESLLTNNYVWSVKPLENPKNLQTITEEGLLQMAENVNKASDLVVEISDKKKSLETELADATKRYEDLKARYDSLLHDIAFDLDKALALHTYTKNAIMDPAEIEELCDRGADDEA